MAKRQGRDFARGEVDRLMQWRSDRWLRDFDTGQACAPLALARAPEVRVQATRAEMDKPFITGLTFSPVDRPAQDSSHEVALSRSGVLRLVPFQHAGTLASCALHLFMVALAFALLTTQNDPGAGGHNIDAIEISLVTSDVLVSRETHAVLAAAAPALEQVAQDSAFENEATRAAEDPPPDKAASPENDAQQTHHEADESLVAALKLAAPTPPPASVASASATGHSSAPQQNGAAAASAGELTRFASDVRATLGRNKPRVQGMRGTLVMQFTIAPDGTVAQAQVATGSGQAKLDALIKAMIERIRFPAPPSRASEKQRTFIVPFRMR